jgi:hypothetical protein
MSIFRSVRNFFLDAIAAGSNGRSDKEIAADENMADAISNELLDVLQLEVIQADDDGSMLVRIMPDELG